jgi:hypothetical protein
MVTALVVGFVAACTAVIWWSNHRVAAVLHTMQESDPPDIPDTFSALDAITQRIAVLENNAELSTARSQELFQAVADGIDHVDRNEKRVRGIVTGAKRRFTQQGYEDAGVDAELDTLPDRDEESGGGQGVLPLRQDMESDTAAPWAETPWAAVPGIERVRQPE